MQYAKSSYNQAINNGEPAKPGNKAVRKAGLTTHLSTALATTALVTTTAISGLGSSYALAHEPHSHPDHAPQHRDYPHDRYPDPRHSPDSRYVPPPHGYWNAVFSTGITFGGEKLAEVDVETYYDDFEREDIRAGELFMFSGGAVYTQDTLQLQGTIGYHVDGIFGDNGDASFTRWPLELLGFLNMPRWRLGGGVTYHMDPELDIDIDNSTDVKVNFKNAAGVVLQADYRLSDQISIGLRHTAIEYEPDNDSNVEIEGDHTGVMLTVLF